MVTLHLEQNTDFALLYNMIPLYWTPQSRHNIHFFFFFFANRKTLQAQMNPLFLFFVFLSLPGRKCLAMFVASHS